MEDLQKIKECPDCASTNILHSQIRDQVICRDCGLIFEPLVLDVESKLEKNRRLKGKPSKPSKPAKKAKLAPKKKAAKKSSKRAKKRR